MSTNSEPGVGVPGGGTNTRTVSPGATGNRAVSPGATGTRAVSTADRQALRWEIALLLAVTFGLSGARAIVRLIDSATQSTALKDQQALLNQRQSAAAWADPILQLLSSGALFAWGGLALFLLLRHIPARPTPHRPKDWLHGAGLAALIGLPGLGFYFTALHLGLSKNIVPTGLGQGPLDIALLVTNAWANGFAEEVIVVAWLITRLRQLNVPWAWVFLASALLRGSYHLYQGFSAGVGNIVMGLVFVWYFRRTGRVWPLVIGHALIDTIAFVGYPLLF